MLDCYSTQVYKYVAEVKLVLFKKIKNIVIKAILFCCFSTLSVVIYPSVLVVIVVIIVVSRTVSSVIVIVIVIAISVLSIVIVVIIVIELSIIIMVIIIVITVVGVTIVLFSLLLFLELFNEFVTHFKKPYSSTSNVYTVYFVELFIHF